jgi:hypothetical protein
VTGQSFLETIIGAGLMLILLILGFIILLKGLGILVATKWAAENSHCIARSSLPDELAAQSRCAKKNSEYLQNHFAFQHVSTRARILHGVIHSDVDASLGGVTYVHGQYDLGASEYRRSSP